MGVVAVAEVPSTSLIPIRGFVCSGAAWQLLTVLCLRITSYAGVFDNTAICAFHVSPWSLQPQSWSEIPTAGGYCLCVYLRCAGDAPTQDINKTKMGFTSKEFDTNTRTPALTSCTRCTAGHAVTLL